MLAQRLPAYVQLVRLDRPAGALLLLWPTLAALWLASGGVPGAGLLAAFVAGTFVMRAAGCVMNDIADRDFDPHVERTRNRPLAAGTVSVPEAAVLLAVLVAAGLAILLTLNMAARWYGAVAVVLIASYPFFKRFTHLPQAMLAITFGWGIPMAFAATTGAVSLTGWLLFGANALWIMAYDTIYAMVDRDDDVRVGVKSTAILFGSADVTAVRVFQIGAVLVLLVLGAQASLGLAWYLAVAAFGACFMRQQALIKNRERPACMTAFRNNAWAGLALFAGIAIDLALPAGNR
ncbi:MAG: 4-hydroxybenzoate octaprenyltransferase [Gammaproteobacteria bacterium]|nr:4-hydroxybenzoate octaprenyltransferase [Gammaproteobacteria bacterium]